MTKQISHYVARFDMPGYKKGDKAYCEPFSHFPDVFAPVYKEDPAIPPGVVAFKNHVGSIDKFLSSIENYEWWAKINLSEPKSTIHTISVNGTEWSCGDWYNHGGKEHYQIKSFHWEANRGWRANTVDESYCYFNEALKTVKGKLPTRTPICQLPDENGNMVDGFDGQTAWVVQDNWKIFECLLHQDNAGRVHRNFFATKAAAEKYVLDNQPFYPRGLVEPLMLLPDVAFDNLNAFKEKHLKGKV